MNDIEELISQYPQISFSFEPMPDRMGGITLGNEITINSNLSPRLQLQWLYEELGHIMTTTGDISEYDSLSNLVQEKEARVWGMKHHVPFYKIKKASKEDVDDDYEVAEELGVQVDYLHEVGSAYGLKYKHLDE